MRGTSGLEATTRRGMAWQLFGFLGGMTTYAVYHLVSPTLVPLSCETGTVVWLHAASALAALLIAAALATAVRIWRSGRRMAATSGASTDLRTAFLGLTGIILNSLALAIIVYAELHVPFLDPCLSW